MNNSKHYSTVSRIIGGARTGAPNVEIKSYALAGDGMARVVLDVTHTAESRENHALVSQSLNKKLNGRMSAIAGTFFSLEKAPFTERLTGIVSVVRQAIPAEGELKGFRAMASNMFMDDEEHMWVLRKSTAGQLLVKTTGIDDDITLANMLESVSSSTATASAGEYSRMIAQASSVAQAAEAGDYVSYVSADNLLCDGFVVASVADTNELVVLANGATEEEVIKNVAVTQIHNQKDFPAFEETKEEKVETVVASSRGGIDLPFLLSYYKKVFARSPAFYQQFAQRLRNHAFF